MFEVKVIRERRQQYGAVRRIHDAAQVYETVREEFGRHVTSPTRWTTPWWPAPWWPGRCR